MKKENKDNKPYGLGRRKSAIAKVRLLRDKETKEVNGIKLEEYFPTIGMQNTALAPLKLTSLADKLGADIVVRGGGKHAQADAVRHGVARALVEYDEELRGQLKTSGMLTRDARVKERKKFGLKRARKAPQFSKR